MKLPPLPPTTDDLLGQMALVVRSRQKTYRDYLWTARAVGCELHGNGATPRAAMLHALEIKKGLEK